jgi:hypothetical protein
MALRTRLRRAAAAAAAAAGVLVLTACTAEQVGEDDDAPEPVGLEVPRWEPDAELDTVVHPADELPGFAGARVVKEPGADHVVLTVSSGQGRAELEPVDADLPGEVMLFHNLGSSLVVTPHDAETTALLDLQVRPEAGATGEGPILLSDGGQSVALWWVDGLVQPEQVRDVYWTSDDDLVAASGADVLVSSAEDIAAGEPVAVIPEHGRWVTVASYESLAVYPWIAEVDTMLPSGEHAVAVLRGDVTQAELVLAGALGQGPGTTVPMTLTEAGDFTIATAPGGGADAVQWTANDGAHRQYPRPSTRAAAVVDDGRVSVRFADPATEVQVDADTTDVVSLTIEGVQLLVARPPAGDQESPTVMAPVFQTPAGLRVRSQDFATHHLADTGFAWASDNLHLPYRPSGDGSSGTPLPTMLFVSDAGPQWATAGAPERLDLADASLAVSVETGRGVWAVQCLGDESANTPPAVGRLAEPMMALARCGTVPGGQAVVVAVVPSEMAARAEAVPATAAGAGSPTVTVGTPEVADLGRGLALWVAPVTSLPHYPRHQLAHLLEGLDVDADGQADLHWE